MPIYDLEETTGHALVKERQRLEDQQPELAGGYRSFLRDYTQFREMQQQLEQRTQSGSPRNRAFAARLK